MEKFACEDETEPNFTVSVKNGILPPPPEGAALLHSTAGTEVFLTNKGWHRRFSAEYGNLRREYAALDYTDTSASLTISPVCSNPTACVQSCTAFEHLTLCAGGLLLHASHILYGGRSILFCAPSGTGKSTQAELWQKFRGAEIINGDKSLLIPREDSAFAAGIPYAGTSDICENISAPLCAVVLLEQSKTNTLLRLRGAAAVSRLMTCVIRYPWHSEDTERALSLAERVISAVPIYLLRCRPDEGAVDCLASELR